MSRSRSPGAACALAPLVIVLAACTTAAPVTEAAARANAQAAFEAVVARSDWQGDLFAPGAMTRSDVGWTASFACRPDPGGALVILVARNGSTGYSLAPPAACRRHDAGTDTEGHPT
jgi:hypothetical protein